MPNLPVRFAGPSATPGKVTTSDAATLAPSGLVVRQVLRGGVCFQEHTRNGNGLNSWSAEDDRPRRRHSRTQHGAARIRFVFARAGTVHLAFDILRMMGVRVVRGLHAGGSRCDAKLVAAEQLFEVAGRNAGQPKHHTSRRNDAESEREL